MLAENVTTPAGIAASSLETIFYYCFMGYIQVHWIIIYHLLLDILHACTLHRNTLFSNVIIGSDFSDYVAFYAYHLRRGLAVVPEFRLEAAQKPFLRICP